MSAGEELSELAYKAYGDYVGWVAHTGNPMPAWPELPADTKGAWAAAALAVIKGL